ncbi:hypothetical protein [Pseudomonas aeruginosa]|uniref:hypothetical protein n=1 Tax=Pseudomonas aeruginosa TaxID=287 RepID=UPI000F547AEF|nr:hypothetical protein [Pseudomonas aeruginosa]RPS65917.1 hypothetical protein IPC1001_07620 [Pseudomonas aeruginosa]RQF77944.1 hypothetical protein IPC258_07975 [Pseudomonas aeruginosa]HBO4049582.1 hypothetical protein [Pseudomonas aeruginosa]HCU2047743.1 hypothetical protein [Pseudomonas aeruginosa]
MSGFQDQSIDEGVRKRTAYQNDRRARLALNVERQDGAILQIPVASDMLGHEEHERIQQNTFLAVMPLVRLPALGRAGYGDQPPAGALPRPGRIYLFQDDKLWRELECDGKGNLFEVDLQQGRKQREDQRPAVGKAQALVLVPVLVKGQFVIPRYTMAYSETTWPWSYIDWLEEDPQRVNRRCQQMASAWNASVANQHWKASIHHPALVIDHHTEGLRPRDFNVESALEDPAEFTPGFAAFREESLVCQLQRSQQELAPLLKQVPPAALPALEAGEDVLETLKLRGHPNLIGLMLDDSLFALRHAASQARHCAAYLRSLNALLPHRPNGRYAQVLSSMLEGPLAKLKDEVDQSELDVAIFAGERQACRVHLTQQIENLVALLEGPLHPVLQDWVHQRDEALLEPYSLMSEALAALNQLPDRCDALYGGTAYRSLAAHVERVVSTILQASHPLGAMLLAKDEEQLPEAVRHLQALRDSQRPPDPDAMGLSTLMLGASLLGEVDQPSAGKSLAYFLGDLLDIFGASVVEQLGRLSQGATQIQLDRLFAPTFNTLSALSVKMKGIRLLPDGQVPLDMVVVGVRGAGLRNGLTEVERQELTRKSYRRAIVQDRAGNPLAGTSPRGTGMSRANLRDVMVVAVPKDHPDLLAYTKFRTQFGALTQVMENTRIVPTMMLGFAIYNLNIQMQAELGGEGRELAGQGSAFLDLIVAIGSHTKLLFGSSTSIYLESPRLPVAKISPLWAKNLELQTGSPKLGLLRGVGGVATLLGTGISVWDGYRALRQGDNDAAAAYGVAAVGGGLWGAYALGWIVNPYALLAGAALAIGGTVVANLLTDSDAETIVKKGPFGRQFAEAGLLDSLMGQDQRFVHLKDPQTAYRQLLGVLGHPRVFVHRLEDWRKLAPAAHRSVLQEAERGRQAVGRTALSCIDPKLQALEANDWAVVLSSPLLAMFENGQKAFRLVAQEFLSSLPIDPGTLLGVKRYHRVPAGPAKLEALPLDAASVLYVLPASLPIPQLSPRARYSVRMTQGLKISAQFELNADQPEERLVLPQPNPKSWSAFTSANRYLPPDDLGPHAAPPYWLIENSEFNV